MGEGRGEGGGLKEGKGVRAADDDECMFIQHRHQALHDVTESSEAKVYKVKDDETR